MEERHRSVLYHPRSVIEDAQKEPGLAPIRLFALLFPLWRVELGGTLRDQKPYALLEAYVERAIYEGALHTTEEISAFFGIDPRLISKVLDFLQTIEHVQCEQGRWSLRPLGLESLREGQKYIPKHNRQEFYFEAFHSQPLPRAHYDHMQVYTEQEAEEVVSFSEHARRGYRCERLFSFHPWSSGTIADLARHPDRDRYNLRQEINDVHQVGQPELVYLPLYLIEAHRSDTQRTYLAYSRVRGRRDHFFEHIVNSYPAIREALAITSTRQQQSTEIWTRWLTRQGLAHVQPLLLPNGIWQLNVPPAVLRSNQPPIALDKIGTYWLEEGHFLYLWCNDLEIRRDAALDRTLRMLDQHKRSMTRREVERNLQLLSTQLAIRVLDWHDLQQRAQKTGRASLLQAVDI